MAFHLFVVYMANSSNTKYKLLQQHNWYLLQNGADIQSPNFKTFCRHQDKQDPGIDI